MSSVECKVQSADCKVQSVECKVWSPERGVESSECGVWSVLETHVGASKRAFRPRLPPILTLCSFSMFSYEFSLEPENLQPQNRCFVQGFRQFSSHLTKCHACHRICTLSPLDAALTMRFAKTHNTTRLKRCACHAKWRWTRPKRCACHENCNSSCGNVAQVLRLPHTTTFCTLRNTSECHEVPRLPRETQLRDAGNIQK